MKSLFNSWNPITIMLTMVVPFVMSLIVSYTVFSCMSLPFEHLSVSGLFNSPGGIFMWIVFWLISIISFIETVSRKVNKY